MDLTPPIPTPTPPQYFDYARAASAAKVSADDLRKLIAIFEADYPSDVMLRELHILRACNAIVRGTSTLRQLLDAAGSRAA